MRNINGFRPQRLMGMRDVYYDQSERKKERGKGWKRGEGKTYSTTTPAAPLSRHLRRDGRCTHAKLTRVTWCVSSLVLEFQCTFVFPTLVLRCSYKSVTRNILLSEKKTFFFCIFWRFSIFLLFLEHFIVFGVFFFVEFLDTKFEIVF